MKARLLSTLAISCSVVLAGCPETTETSDTGVAPVDARSSSPDAFVPPGVDAGELPDAFAAYPDAFVETDAPMTMTTVSFATDVAPIITSSCGGGRCHNTRPYAFLMGSTRCSAAADRRYVVPGSPDTSYVVAKITGGAICGSAMPPTRRLTAAQIATIRTWISEGALDN